jgi:hypothetical protein
MPLECELAVGGADGALIGVLCHIKHLIQAPHREAAALPPGVRRQSCSRIASTYREGLHRDRRTPGAAGSCCEFDKLAAPVPVPPEPRQGVVNVFAFVYPRERATNPARIAPASPPR